LVGAGIAFLCGIGALVGYGPTTVLGLGIPIVLLLGVGVFSAPELSVIVYAMLRPFADAAVHVQVGGVSLGTVWGAGFMVVLACYWFLVGFRRPLRGYSWFVPVVFVIAYAVLAFGRGDFSYTLSTWVKIASFVLFALTCEQIAGTRKGQVLIQRAGVVLAILTVAVMGLALASNQYGPAYYAGQAESVTQGPHALASMGVLASAFVWIGAMFGRRRGRYLLLAAVLAIGICLSLVRTTFLAFAILALWFLFWGFKNRSRGALAIATTAFAAAVAAVWAFQDTLSSRISDLAFLVSGGGQELQAGSGRIGIWATVLQSATATSGALLFGQGSGASLAATSAMFGAALWSHNDFIEFLITGGVGLLLIYLMVIAWLFVSTAKLAMSPQQSPQARAVGRLMVVMVVAFVVMAFFNGIIFFQSSMAMAMVVGLARGMAETPGATYLDEEHPLGAGAE